MDETILWHQERREQGSPVVTGLRGTVDDASRAWIDCWRRQGRPVVSIIQFDPEPLTLAWIGSLVEKPDFLPLCLATIARANGEQPGWIFAGLIAKPEIELELFLDRVVATHFGEPVRRLCRAIFRAASSHLAPGDVAQDILEATGGLAAAVRAFRRLVPGNALPALLLCPEAEAAEVASADMKHLCRLAEAEPLLPVGVVLSASQESVLVKKVANSRWEVLLREGLVRVEPPPKLKDETVTASGAALARSLAFLTREGEGLPPAEIERLRTLGQEAAAILDASTPEVVEHARSAAEAFLFAVLERLPATRGRFRLNQSLGVRFGPKRVEVDLLAAEQGVAIEIDGFHHFSDPDAYRRDRRKDVLLQQYGLLVLRFLASDVVTRLEEILDAILSALRYRGKRERTDL
ncbi:MAG: endonuclease domain-containing protein [Gammaproteobacteria bacterium]